MTAGRSAIPGSDAGLRVLALVTDAFGGHGGIAQYNRDLLQALAGTAASSRVLVLPSVAPVAAVEPPAGVEQRAAPASRATYAVAAAVHALRDGPFDVVFCGHLHLAPIAWAAARCARARLWLQLHGIEAWERPRLLRRQCAERADFVTAVSRHTRRRFLAWSRIDPHRVRVLPNTVDPAFAPGPKPRTLVDKLGLDGQKILLTVGRLASGERYKGHDRVIESLSALKERHPGLVYLVAGDGPDRERLQQLVRNHGVSNMVRFLGRVAEEDLPYLFRLADAYVMPSSGEGFGIVFLEALATGLPVIAGDADGSRDPLADGELGLLVSRDDQSGLLDAIRRALSAQAPPPGGAGRFARTNFASHVSRLVPAMLS